MATSTIRSKRPIRRRLNAHFHVCVDVDKIDELAVANLCCVKSVNLAISLFVSRSLGRNARALQETPVPPKCANEIRVPPMPLMSDEFVSVLCEKRRCQSGAKSRKSRRNSHERKDTNMMYINILVR